MQFLIFIVGNLVRRLQQATFICLPPNKRPKHVQLQLLFVYATLHGVYETCARWSVYKHCSLRSHLMLQVNALSYRLDLLYSTLMSILICWTMFSGICVFGCRVNVPFPCFVRANLNICISAVNTVLWGF